MEATETTTVPEPAEATADEKTGEIHVTPRHQTPKQSIDIPIRMLHAVGVAARENTKYSMDGVLVEGSGENGLITVVATDGRRLIVTEWNRGLFDDDARIMVTGSVARTAAELGRVAAPGSDEPMATLTKRGDACTITVLTEDGAAVLSWTETEFAFPPYRDVIPDWSDSTGVSEIAITPELVAGSLKTMQKIVGKEPKVRIFLPSRNNRPLGFESQDGVKLKVLAVVMPVDISPWLEKPQEIKGGGKKSAGAVDATAPLPFADDAWRAVKIADLTPSLKPGKLKCLEENTPPILTLGDLSDWQTEKGEWWWKDVKGFGESGVEQLAAATDAHWKANPRHITKPLATGLNRVTRDDLEYVHYLDGEVAVYRHGEKQEMTPEVMAAASAALRMDQRVADVLSGAGVNVPPGVDAVAGLAESITSTHAGSVTIDKAAADRIKANVDRLSGNAGVAAVSPKLAAMISAGEAARGTPAGPDGKRRMDAKRAKALARAAGARTGDPADLHGVEVEPATA